MDFNWSEFYRFAAYLNNDDSFDCQEAVQRTIVSRAYYAAFCMAKEAIEHKCKISFQKSADTHERVRFEYKKQGRSDISDTLTELRRFRNMCDYEKDIKNLHSLVKISLQTSEQIISKINSIH